MLVTTYAISIIEDNRRECCSYRFIVGTLKYTPNNPMAAYFVNYPS